MIEPVSRQAAIPQTGVHPIAVAAVALALVLIGIGSIALWRAYTGNSPETERAAASRQVQLRTAQLSEQLAEKAKGLESTQQESIDQLQALQDQMMTMRRMLASQQADNKKLSDQVTTLSEAVESLRQSFASARATEPEEPAARSRATKSKPRANRNVSRKRSKTRA